jgi:hypothetical protein
VAGAALALGLTAASASALTIGGQAALQVDPVYFHMGGNLGLNAGPGFDFAVSSGNDWITQGTQPGDVLSIQQSLQTPVLQNPQFPASSMNPLGPQGIPSTTNPFVADSTWTVTNKSTKPLKNAYVVFEGVDLAPTTLLPKGYPDILVGIDKNLFSIIRYTSPQLESPLFFGALSLGSLGAKDSTQIHVRYIVAGTLPQVGANLVMPPFEVIGLINVPEPSTLVLLAGGLALIAAAGRRRCA